MSEPRYNGNEIAIIGAAGRFPGAPDLTTYWQNLRAGVESIHHFGSEEWHALNLPQSLLEDPNFVRAAAFLDHPDAFDASFFDMSHREAELTDPQHRVLLECAWTALEDAGYQGAVYPGAVGVFAGATINTYLLFHLAARPDVIGNLSHVQLNVGNAGDFLATRIAYKLNLKGPSYTVQSACSTSLVAVHIACESLLNEECDMALAGGVSVNVSLRHGYAYVEGGMTSPDGHCRPFDAAAQGTIFGSGAGLVVLKRLRDALHDGDTIHAVIKGTAINNDGSLKVGYTAPSVEGQAQVVAEALANAGVSAETIQYVEAHGTATPLGDPIEVEALTKAFRAYTAANGFCALGSVKGNIGHLDAAAGIAGLLKTVLALKHRELPPSLHFERPNPNIDFPNTPFYVNTGLSRWPDAAAPRRAGVSAFGVGGTNAHVILEEAPVPTATEPSRAWQLLILSARTQEALEKLRANLADHWQTYPTMNIADVAYTLQVGRQPFRYRQMVLAQVRDDALAALTTPDQLSSSTVDENRVPSLVFMFTGQGSQQVNMGRGLYEQEPAYRQTVDHCAQVLRPRLGLDVRELLYPRPGMEAEAAVRLNQTAYAQPALFVVEYAVSQLLLSWGLRPQALVGHSIGEYVAACLSGVFSLEEALLLIAERGRLMQALPGGAMLAVPLSESELQPFLNGDLSLAVINGPGRTVVSGSQAAITQFEAYLQAEGIMARPLTTSHAFHSVMMEPIIETFTEAVTQISLRPPQIPYLSNVTGTWITAAEATSPAYWARHLRGTVRFADNITTLLEGSGRILLEVGPGETLCQLVRRHPHYHAGHTVFPLLTSPRQQQVDDLKAVLQTIGQLWLRGLAPDWQQFYGTEHRRRVPLPTYPLARQRHWIEAAPPDHVPETRPVTSERNSSDKWFYLPAWKRILPPVFEQAVLLEQPRCWLIFADEQGVATEVIHTLNTLQQTVIVVRAGSDFQAQGTEITLNPARPQNYESLVAHLRQNNAIPNTVLHLWHISSSEQTLSFAEYQTRGYYSLLYLVQALGNTSPLTIVVAANQLLGPLLDSPTCPEKATILGVCQVLPQEYAALQCQVVDVRIPISRNAAASILALATRPTATAPLVIRGAQCWQQHYELVAEPAAAALPLTQQGVYLMSGGLLEMGLQIAHYLSQTVQARLILLEETPFPAPAAWDEWLNQHGPTDDISVKIMQARRLCDTGAKLLVLGVDYADAGQIQAAVRQGAAQFGPIQGFIHNARVLGERSFRLASETGVTESEWQFVPKVHGLKHLAQALTDQPLRFALLNSSLSSIMGGVGMAAYAAANRFVDAFARQQNQAWGGVWTTVNWDAWKNTQVAAVSAEWSSVALNPEEAIISLEHILAMPGVEQVVISTLDLPLRLARSRAAAAETHTAQSHRSTATLHPRPEQLSTLYLPPEDEQERAIVAVWQEALGVMPVGVLDNFFELGGDSLLAVHTISQLKKVLQTDIPVVTLYEGLTVRSLATALKQAAVAAAHHDETAAIREEERATRLSQRRKVQEESRARRERRQQH